MGSSSFASSASSSSRHWRSLAIVVIALILITITIPTSAYTTFDTSIYDNSVELSSSYTLYWLVNRTSSTIRFGIQTQTTGL
jgi:hypothetical protein